MCIERGREAMLRDESLQKCRFRRGDIAGELQSAETYQVCSKTNRRLRYVENLWGAKDAEINKSQDELTQKK